MKRDRDNREINFEKSENDAQNKKAKNHRKLFIKPPTLSLKLVMLLGCFSLFLVIVMFATQILVSDNLYENVKVGEVKSSCTYIENKILSGEENIEKSISKIAEKNNVSIGYYTIKDDNIEKQYATVVLIDSVVFNPSEETLRSFYELAKNNGGIYSGKFGFDFFEPKSKNPVSEEEDESSPISVIYVKVFENEGKEHMLLLNADVTPIAAAKKTFGVQFTYVLVFLMTSLILMAYVMSKVISEPLKSINQSAKKLANGNYNVEFHGSGYREINELSKTLNYASSELSKNDYLQKELIANISHDLRTPLTMIKGYSEMMRDIPGENTPENIQAIIDETTRLSELVNNLLELSKIESGTAVIKKERVNLTEAVKEAMERYSKMDITNKYNISFEYDEDVYVYVDRSMLLQVVYNLVNNAINYCGDDKYIGVIQTVKTSQDGRKMVRVSVVDHGIGIESDKLPLIWDRYYKVDSVHKRAVVGTGIGLSIVKNILKHHSALYGVDSKVGEGSTFWFELEVE